MPEPSFAALLEQAASAQSATAAGDPDLTPVITAVLRLLFNWIGGSLATTGEASAQGMLAALISEAEQR
jgi:hypothetical protein